jgi:pimeloyl-ACP methyl ester carboxylesterase
MQDPEFLDRPGGVRLAYRIFGEGPPVLLIHGFLSSAMINWIRPGTAGTIARAGFRVIVPDLRGHGLSGSFDAAAACPPDCLALDMKALLAAENAPDARLIGYSLGARTVVRLLARGARPAKFVLGGMGLPGILDMSARQVWFISAIENRETLQPDDPGYEVVKFLKLTGTDPESAVRVLRSQVTSTMTDLGKATMPGLVIVGDKDEDNGSARDLAAAMPHARYAEIKGNHMNAVGNPKLAEEIVAFLSS